MLTCRDLTEQCTDYLEGRLPFGQRLGFQLHLAMCRHCRAYLRQLRATIHALGRLPTEAMPAELQKELHARFQHWQQAAPRA